MNDNQRQVNTTMYLQLTLALCLLSLHAHGDVNVALRQPAFLSSTRSSNVASRGNDGSTSTAAHSLYDSPAWWCVQLPTIYMITEIHIYNRDDEFSTRLRGFQIRMSDFESCSAANFNSARICHTDTTESRHFYKVNSCNQVGGFAGRYIYLNTASGNYLSIKEFKLFGIEKYPNNVALQQPAVLSSRGYGNTGASKGNDGNRKTIVFTKLNSPGWWCVQLPDAYRIIKINIRNREDDRFRGRLRGFQIRMSTVGSCSAANFNSARICHKDTTGSRNFYTVNSCNQGGEFVGRYIYLNTASRNYLHFKEFQLFGIGISGNNVALNQPAVLSSTHDSHGASRGNDGSLSTITHSNRANPSWWCVQLPSIYNFLKIRIYNRIGQTANRLRSFEIRLSDFSSCSAANFNSARVCHKDPHGTYNEYNVNRCNQGGEFSGRYVYINTGNLNYLNFREFQVFGQDLNVLPNVALNKQAFQSSGEAEQATDGDVNTCSRNTAWLCVDLDKMYILDNIQLIHYPKVTGYEIKIDRVNYCSTAGFNTATLCYRDTVGATSITQCNQDAIQFDARAIYFSVPNESISVCEVVVHPYLDPTCTLVNPH